MNRADLDKQWEDFVVETTKLWDKHCQVIAQLERTLEDLRSTINPYNLPYGYSDRREQRGER